MELQDEQTQEKLALQMLDKLKNLRECQKQAIMSETL
jgi:hypothetical protein